MSLDETGVLDRARVANGFLIDDLLAGGDKTGLGVDALLDLDGKSYRAVAARAHQRLLSGAKKTAAGGLTGGTQIGTDTEEGKQLVFPNRAFKTASTWTR